MRNCITNGRYHCVLCRANDKNFNEDQQTRRENEQSGVLDISTRYRHDRNEFAIEQLNFAILTRSSLSYKTNAIQNFLKISLFKLLDYIEYAVRVTDVLHGIQVR